MVKMPPDVKQTLEKQRPLPVATASSDGTPNVVFVGLFKVLDDETVMIVDNFFKKTAENLAENPKVSLLCYSPDTKKSFQIKGSVEACSEGQTYEEMKSWVKGVNEKLPAKGCAIVRVQEIYNAMWGPGAGDKIV